MDRSRAGERSPFASRESLPCTPSLPAASLSTPSLHGGTVPEPKSELLRSILQEKRAGRRVSPARRRPSMSSSYTGDEWTALSESETPTPARTTTRRRPGHGRRASVADVPVRTAAPTKQMTVKETNDLITKLQNENFDVKLRLTLTQERVVKLEQELENSKARSNRADQLEERNTELEDQVARLQERLDALTKDKATLEEQHQEDLSINDALVKELEQRDTQLLERDAAVEEAATLIDQLQRENQQLQANSNSKSPKIYHQSSDYFSSEAESQPVPKLSSKASSIDMPGSRPSTSPGSDYFSNGSSPSLRPRSSTPRPLSRRQSSITRPGPQSPANLTNTVDQKPAQPATLLDSRSAMELIASAEKVRRPLMLRTRTSPKYSRPIPRPAAAHPTQLPTSRPLRNLYLSGELNRRLDIPAPPVPPHRELNHRAGSLTPEETYPTFSLFDSDQQQQRSPSEASVASDSTVSFHPNMGGIRQAPAYPPWPVTNGMLARDFLFNPHVEDLELGSPRRRRTQH